METATVENEVEPPVESRIEYVILRPLKLPTSFNAKTRSNPTPPSIALGRLQVSPAGLTHLAGWGRLDP